MFARTLAPALGGQFPAAHFRALLLKNGFARKPDPVAFDGQHFHQDLIALLELIADVLDTVLGHFADVQQPVGAGNDFDEGPKVGQPGHGAQVGLPHFGRRRQVANNLQRPIGGGFVVRSHVHFARVFHIDLHSGLLDDAANHLATGPDDIANLIHRNLQGVDARRVGGNFLPRRGQNLVHLAEDVQPSPLRLRQGFAHDLRRDAPDLDIHLQGGNAVLGAGDFEVHVAVVIFGARDIGQDGVVVVFLHQSHGHARNRRLQRHARIHERKRSSANRSHRRRSIRFQNIGDHAHGIGPLVFARQHPGKSPLRQCPVSDLPPPRAPQEGDLPHREGREIVVQHEALLGFAFEGFQALHVVARAQGRGHQSLGFAAREDGGAVGAGQDAGLDPDGADLIEGAAVGAALLIENLLAEDALPQGLVVGLELGPGLFVFFRDLRLQFFLEVADQVVAFRFGMLFGVEAVGQVGANFRLQRVVVGLVEFRRSDGALGLAGFFPQLVDGGADLFDLGVAEFDGVDHGFFFHFFGDRLDHHDAIGGSDDHDAQQAFADFGVGGIDHEVTIDQAHTHRANRPEERNVGKGQRAGSGVNADHVRIILAVGGKNEGDHLGLALEALGKQRPHRTVDHAAGKNFAFARTAFALDESAGKAAAGVGIFAVVHGQGEEVNSFPGLGVGHTGGQNDVVPHADHRRAVRLFGQFSSFKGEGFAAGEFYRYFMLHDFVSFWAGEHASAGLVGCRLE